MDEQELTTPPKPPRARARREDPQTSHQAADKVEIEGKATGLRRICLQQVRRSPGQTAGEIAAALGVERCVPSRRLPELREAGLVANGPPRRCVVMGTSCMTWIPATPPPPANLVQRELL
jgi:hypothetical protein